MASAVHNDAVLTARLAGGRPAVVNAAEMREVVPVERGSDAKIAPPVSATVTLTVSPVPLSQEGGEDGAGVAEGVMEGEADEEPVADDVLVKDDIMLTEAREVMVLDSVCDCVALAVWV